jgi:hypothetical protein
MAIFVCTPKNQSRMVAGIRKDREALLKPLDCHALFVYGGYMNQEQNAGKGKDETIKEQEELIAVLNNVIESQKLTMGTVKKRLDAAQEELNLAKGRTRTGGVMVPSFDVDNIVNGTFVFHFQKLKVLEWLFELWATDHGLMANSERDVFDGMAAIVREAYDAYDEVRESLHELDEKHKAGLPEPTQAEVLEAVAKASQEPEGRKGGAA